MDTTWVIDKIEDYVPNPLVSGAIHVVLTNGTEQRHLLLQKAAFYDIDKYCDTIIEQAGHECLPFTYDPDRVTDEHRTQWTHIAREHFRKSYDSN